MTARFKAGIALAALCHESSIPELSREYNIHPDMIHAWELHLVEHGGVVRTGGQITKTIGDLGSIVRAGQAAEIRTEIGINTRHPDSAIVGQ